MGQPPLVSVIIPAYNAVPWIDQTISSVLEQTYSAVEVLVIDDASKDATVEKLRTFGNRIRLLENKTNQGLSASRNRAIATATGDYIALLDHDDLWEPQKLERQMNLFTHDPELGLVYCDAIYRNSDHSQWRSFQASPPKRGHVFRDLLRENFIPCLTALISRPVLAQVGGFRADLRILEDHELFLRIAKLKRIDYVDEVLATYRVHAGNFTRHRYIYHAERIQVYSIYEKELAPNGEIALQQLGLGIALLNKRSWKCAGTLARGALNALKHPVAFMYAGKATWLRKRRVVA